MEYILLNCVFLLLTTASFLGKDFKLRITLFILHDRKVKAMGNECPLVSNYFSQNEAICGYLITVIDSCHSCFSVDSPGSVPASTETGGTAYSAPMGFSGKSSRPS